MKFTKLESRKEETDLRKRKRERQILHNYMEVLAANYENMEPEKMSDSICKIYDRLNPARNSTPLCVWLILANLLIYFFVFIKKLFGSKTR